MLATDAYLAPPLTSWGWRGRCVAHQKEIGMIPGVCKLIGKMLLTITTTHSPATALGYLLHKHPDRFQSFKLTFGKASVFYPEASLERCTAALLLDVDPVGLVRKQRGEGYQLEQYVNDRPYVASSFLSVAIAQVFGTALAGRCKDQPELAQTPIPLTAKLSVLPCKSGEAFLRRLFEPLSYTVTAEVQALDEQFPEWGKSPYFTVELQGVVRLQDLLSHLYVLIPVLDDEKHYWVGDDEVDKLLRHGEGWLTTHPEQQQIAKRYLKRQGRLVRTAIAQLVEEDNPEPDDTQAVHELEEVAECFGYSVQFLPVGSEDVDVGAPTQMGVFSRD